MIAESGVKGIGRKEDRKVVKDTEMKRQKKKKYRPPSEIEIEGE